MIKSRKTWADVLSFENHELPRELIGEIFLRLDPVCAAYQTHPLIIKVRNDPYYRNLWVKNYSSFAISYSELLEPLPCFSVNSDRPLSAETIHLMQLLMIGLDQAVRFKLTEYDSQIKLAGAYRDPSRELLIKQRMELISEIFYHPCYYTGGLIVQLFDQIRLLGRARFVRARSMLFQMLHSDCRLPIELVNQLYHKVKLITRNSEVDHHYHLLAGLIEGTLLTFSILDGRLIIAAAVYDNLQLAEHCLFGRPVPDLTDLYDLAVKYRADKILQLIRDRGSEVSCWSLTQMIRPTVPWELVRHLTRHLSLCDLLTHDGSDLNIKLYHEREWSDEQVNQAVNQICKNSYEYGQTVLPLLFNRLDCVTIEEGDKGDNYLLYHSLRYGNGYYQSYPDSDDNFPLSDDYSIYLTPEQAQAELVVKHCYRLSSVRYQTITIINGPHHLAISDYYADSPNVYHRQQDLDDGTTELAYHVLNPGESITLNSRQVGELNIVSFDL